jgi:hypothetical protein
MDERLAKKVGEIKAFNLLGIELLQKAETPLEIIFSAEELVAISDQLEIHLQKLNQEIENTNFLNVIEEKTTKTKEKVGSMQNTYIGDKWDDPIELCEWLGFFEGAAIVHFSLVKALAEQKNLGTIAHIAEDGATFHRNLLERVTVSIKKLASNDLTI